MRLLFLTLALLIGFSTSASAQECLEYGPTVSLTGTLRSKVFPGPPEYVSIKRGDRAETAMIVKLAAPICTTSKQEKPDDLSIPETDVRDVQLVLTTPAHWKAAKSRLGKSIVVSGTLYHAHTGHHRTKVLMMVSELKPKP